MIRYKLYIFVFHYVCIVHPSATSEKNPLLLFDTSQLYRKSVEGPPIFNLKPPDTVADDQQRSKLDFLKTLNRQFAADWEAGKYRQPNDDTEVWSDETQWVQ